MHQTSISDARIHDQARVLRDLVGRRSRAGSAAKPTAVNCRSLAVVSGKGGVGKSLVALNLAVALAQLNRKVCLLDANLGLGSLELMCGLNGYWNLSHLISGAKQLSEVRLSGPQGVDLIPGASGILDMGDYSPAVQQTLLDEFQSLERQYDFLIIDTGSGMHRVARQFAWAADQMLVITTPEPTSITDAYATVKSLCGSQRPPLGLVVNQSDSAELAAKVSDRLRHTTRMFVHANIDGWGTIPRDTAVPASINLRQPVVVHAPQSPAAEAIRQLAHRWLGNLGTHPQGTSYFSRLLPNLPRAA